ncbi:MAG TPA: hypothetical protein VF855_07225 [Acidimicrobiales bacterium]
MLAPRTMVWVGRVLWLLAPLVFAPAMTSSLDGRSSTVVAVALGLALTGWTVALVAVLVPTTVSLTVVRLIVPAALATALVTVAAGATAIAGALAIAQGVLAMAVAMSAEVGQVFVQGSAYGSERRFSLRPPGPLVLGPLEVAWLVLYAPAASGPLLLASRQWLAGSAVTLVAVALVVLLAPRFHRLARRWFVVVPTGVVLHDPIVLADTAMFPRRQITEITLAPADSAALDLTGRALGLAVEVRLRDTATVVMAGTMKSRQGRGVHVRSFLFTPSRPGALLEAVTPE